MDVVDELMFDIKWLWNNIDEKANWKDVDELRFKILEARKSLDVAWKSIVGNKYIAINAKKYYYYLIKRYKLTLSEISEDVTKRVKTFNLYRRSPRLHK